MANRGKTNSCSTMLQQANGATSIGPLHNLTNLPRNSSTQPIPAPASSGGQRESENESMIHSRPCSSMATISFHAVPQSLKPLQSEAAKIQSSHPAYQTLQKQKCFSRTTSYLSKQPLEIQKSPDSFSLKQKICAQKIARSAPANASSPDCQRAYRGP